nr:hypothetical protein CFP56_02226 [Quercus suber]
MELPFSMMPPSETSNEAQLGAEEQVARGGEERKSATATLDNVERQAEGQRILLPNAKDQLAASKKQIIALKKNLEEVEKAKSQAEKAKEEAEKAKEEAE